MLAELVREHRDEVVEIALQRLRELAPGRPPPEPHYFSSLFDQLVSDMEQGRAGDDASSLSTAAASHGRSTQRLGIDLHFLAHDFGVVCDAVSEMALRTNTTF